MLKARDYLERFKNSLPKPRKEIYIHIHIDNRESKSNEEIARIISEQVKKSLRYKAR